MDWAPQADPQTREEAQHAPCYAGIVRDARKRGITRIVHFTRTGGLKGILHTSVVKARSDLPKDARVRHVYEENATDRSRDLGWHGYINLSVTEINMHIFRRSREWHTDDKWVILEFSQELLGHSGVVFCTTNNAYALARRCAGPRGFEQMFAPEVPWGYYGSTSDRQHRARNQTTDPQAEVLYLFELSLDHLHTITVGDEDTYDTVRATLYHFPHDPEVVISPEAFR